ncbi:hypothetical protein BDQ17DRAFT_147382 [Cyathus striatus]|nr:hypothetical protein BDQ17DRAFT_147382 [Cyathus striatus]
MQYGLREPAQCRNTQSTSTPSTVDRATITLELLVYSSCMLSPSLFLLACINGGPVDSSHWTRTNPAPAHRLPWLFDLDPGYTLYTRTSSLGFLSPPFYTTEEQKYRQSLIEAKYPQIRGYDLLVTLSTAMAWITKSILPELWRNVYDECRCVV